MRNAARRQSWHFWPALSEVDALWVDAPPSPAFARYLAAAGLRPPEFLAHADPATAARAGRGRLFTPFGWNLEAHALNRLAGRPARAPSFEATQRVNARTFSAALERELFGEAAGPCVFWASPAELKRGIRGLAPGRYRAKGNHGLAGIGHLRFEATAGEGGAASAAALRKLLERHAGLAVEREHSLEREWGILFRMNRAGRGALRAHRLWTLADGAFSGALVLPGEDPELAPWREELEASVTKISRALTMEGYFGPVSLDTYAWRDGALARFRSLVDLNARASMAWPAHGLAARFPGRAAAVVQVPATALRLPGDHEALAKTWGEFAFDPRRGTGALWLTPLLPLPRHSLGFVGDDAAHIERLRRGVARVSLREGTFRDGGRA